MFAGVPTNVGGGYNASTSIFTCPTSAFYYVYANLLLNIDDNGYDYCWVDVMLDGESVAEVRHVKHAEPKAV